MFAEWRVFDNSLRKTPKQIYVTGEKSGEKQIKVIHSFRFFFLPLFSFFSSSPKDFGAVVLHTVPGRRGLLVLGAPQVTRLSITGQCTGTACQTLPIQLGASVRK